MDWGLLITFATTFASILALPGPNAAFAVGQSLKYGARKSLAVAVGFMLATCVHGILVLSGLGVLIQRHASALVLLKWCGVAYLTYLAIKAFRSGVNIVTVSSQTMTVSKMMLSAMAVSLTNPKALLASLMIYPLFIKSSGTYISQAVALVAVAMAISFSIYATYIVGASKLGKHLRGSKWANKIVASFYLGAAGVLASKST
ncbi:LysE family translocator [Marinobacter sp. SS13-12]|uniref:LysE family translocator n=1 Tax=Marinobacter sp. SS13-12 TaxID=3050451 RepID=UPI002555CCED|nr:LysE family translocator [Marinobacter sp. SS13-12]MDK8465887.1 LysE family translocator [Marinobacter sp. SS13-12]